MENLSKSKGSVNSILKSEYVNVKLYKRRDKEY